MVVLQQPNPNPNLTTLFCLNKKKKKTKNSEKIRYFFCLSEHFFLFFEKILFLCIFSKFSFVSFLFFFIWFLRHHNYLTKLPKLWTFDKKIRFYQNIPVSTKNQNFTKLSTFDKNPFFYENVRLSTKTFDF